MTEKEIPQTRIEPLQENPIQSISVSVNLGERGKINLTGSGQDVCRAVEALGSVEVDVPSTVAAPVVAAPVKGKSKRSKKASTKAKTKALRPPPPDKHYAVFFNEENVQVKRTPYREKWTETRRDVKEWISKHGKKAKLVLIYKGDTQAENRGSRMEKARTAWHITE